MKYEIDHGADGWPITKDGEPMDKKAVVAELNRLNATVEGLTERGCLPPTWLEAEQLRRELEEFLEGFSGATGGEVCSSVVEGLNTILDRVVAADSLPVSTQVHDLLEEVGRLRAERAA